MPVYTLYEPNEENRIRGMAINKIYHTAVIILVPRIQNGHKQSSKACVDELRMYLCKFGLIHICYSLLSSFFFELSPFHLNCKG